jgi:hypothetical protein
MSSWPSFGATNVRLRRLLLPPLLLLLFDANDSLTDAREGALFPRSWSRPCCNPCCSAKSGAGKGVGATGSGEVTVVDEGEEEEAPDGPDDGAFTTRKPVNGPRVARASAPSSSSPLCCSTKSMAASSAGTPHVRVQT